MKISEYIQHLEEIKLALGDVSVLAYTRPEGPLKLAEPPGMYRRDEGDSAVCL